MKNVKIPVAYWDCILTQREKERWRGAGRDGETAVERERQREGTRQKGFLGVGFRIWCCGCFRPDARRRGRLRGTLPSRLANVQRVCV